MQNKYKILTQINQKISAKTRKCKKEEFFMQRNKHYYDFQVAHFLTKDKVYCDISKVKIQK